MWQGDDKDCLIASAWGVTSIGFSFDPVSGQSNNKTNNKTYDLRM